MHLDLGEPLVHLFSDDLRVFAKKRRPRHELPENEVAAGRPEPVLRNGLEYNAELASEAVRIEGGEVVAKPARGGVESPLATKNECEEQARLRPVAAECRIDGLLAERLVVARPRSETDEGGGKPVARGLNHQLLAHLLNRLVADVADVEGLERSDG